MQTISLPYQCNEDDCVSLDTLRETFSAAVRLAYCRAAVLDPKSGKWKVLQKKDVKSAIRSKFSSGDASPRILRSAAYEAWSERKRVPDGSICWGGKGTMRRRTNGLISREEIRRARLRPFAVVGEACSAGNPHFRLDPDDPARCVIRPSRGMALDREIKLTLPSLDPKSKWGRLLKAAARMAADDKLAISFRIDDTRLHITFDAAEVAAHPERLPPIAALPGRILGVDLNPEWIGATVADVGDDLLISGTAIVDHNIYRFEDEIASRESTRQHLSYVADGVVAMAREHRAGVISLEKLGGLGGGNGLLSRWARSVFGSLLRRKARLAGIEITEVWCGYSSTIGNIGFSLPDACASAAEIARRGLALRRGEKELLPAFDRHEALRGVVAAARARGNARGTEDNVSALIGTVGGWLELHGKLRQAKFGVRRPHPMRRGRRTSSLAGAGANPVPNSLRRRLTAFVSLPQAQGTRRWDSTR